MRHAAAVRNTRRKDPRGIQDIFGTDAGDQNTDELGVVDGEIDASPGRICERGKVAITGIEKYPGLRLRIHDDETYAHRQFAEAGAFDDTIEGHEAAVKDDDERSRPLRIHRRRHKEAISAERPPAATVLTSLVAATDRADDGLVELAQPTWAAARSAPARTTTPAHGLGFATFCFRGWTSWSLVSRRRPK